MPQNRRHKSVGTLWCAGVLPLCESLFPSTSNLLPVLWRIMARSDARRSLVVGHYHRSNENGRTMLGDSLTLTRPEFTMSKKNTPSRTPGKVKKKRTKKRTKKKENKRKGEGKRKRNKELSKTYRTLFAIPNPGGRHSVPGEKCLEQGGVFSMGAQMWIDNLFTGNMLGCRACIGQPE